MSHKWKTTEGGKKYRCPNTMRIERLREKVTVDVWAPVCLCVCMRVHVCWERGLINREEDSLLFVFFFPPSENGCLV